MIEVPYVNLSAQSNEERDDLLPIIESILESGQYIGSKEIEQLESLSLIHI